MTPYRGTPRFLLAVFLTFIPALAWDQAPPTVETDTPDRRPGWTAGVGMIYITRPYRAIDDRIVPLPFLAYRGIRLTVLGPRASFLIVNRGPLKANAIVALRFAGYDPKDSSFLTGMQKRRDTLEAGTSVELKLPSKTSLSFHWRADTLDRHNGYELEASLRRVYGSGRFSVAPSIDWTYLSSNLTAEYFGVSQREVLPGRPAYTPSSAHNLSAGLSGFFQTRGAMSIFTGFKISRLPNQVTRSPVVSERAETRTIMGIMWNLGHKKRRL